MAEAGLIEGYSGDVQVTPVGLATSVHADKLGWSLDRQHVALTVGVEVTQAKLVQAQAGVTQEHPVSTGTAHIPPVDASRQEQIVHTVSVEIADAVLAKRISIERVRVRSAAKDHAGFVLVNGVGLAFWNECRIGRQRVRNSRVDRKSTRLNSS